MVKAREKIDPSKTQLRRDIDIFMKQEMQHCRQHLAFNRQLHKLGYDGIKPFEERLETTYNRFLETKSLRFNLAYCEGFESLSATACELYFEGYNELLEGADPEPTDMWRWHLAEEFEHRTVCSDVYHELSGLDRVSRYFYRLYGYFYAVIHLTRFTVQVSKFLLEQDRRNMTPDQLAASLARDKHARKIMARGFLPMAFRIMAPWYNPLHRRMPIGYQEYLEKLDLARASLAAAG